MISNKLSNNECDTYMDSVEDIMRIPVEIRGHKHKKMVCIDVIIADFVQNIQLCLKLSIRRIEKQ